MTGQKPHTEFGEPQSSQPEELDIKKIEKELFDLLSHHKIRDLLKDLCRSNGHSYTEEVEELYNDRIIWKICFGGVAQGTTMVSCLCIFDLTDEFNYHSQVIDFYGQALESYLRDKDKIPADL